MHYTNVLRSLGPAHTDNSTQLDTYLFLSVLAVRQVRLLVTSRETFLVIAQLAYY